MNCHNSRTDPFLNCQGLTLFCLFLTLFLTLFLFLFWIGPEGDFTPGEMSAIKAAGALPITLGPFVLRAETAAVYCLSILNYVLQSPPADHFPPGL